MTEQQVKEFWDMIKEFENSQTPKHQYTIEMRYCDGTTDTMTIFVDFIAIIVILNKLKSYGIWAKASSIKRSF